MNTLSQAFIANSSKLFKSGVDESVKVLKTKDYDQFSFIDGNRDINKENLTRIKQSMVEKYIPVPIIVNDRYEIIDGQHRFLAAKSLSLAIHFIVIPKLKLEDVQRLNTNSSNWGNKQYLQSYCKRGYRDYLLFRDFQEETGHSYNSSIALLTNSLARTGQHKRDFDKGLFKVTDLDGAYSQAKKLADIGQFFEDYKQGSFVYCMLRLFRNKKYNHKIFLRKLELQPTGLKKEATMQKYLEAVEKVYNYRTADINKVRFY
jgi:hypothetical protein